MLIKKLSKNDFQKYIKLMKQFRPIDINLTKNDFENLYDKIFLNSEIYITELNENIVGSITIIYEQKFINNLSLYAHIEDVIVHQDYRNKKIGSALLEFAKNRAKEKGCFKCVLVCSEENSNFYLKNNFEKRGVCMSYLIN